MGQFLCKRLFFLFRHGLYAFGTNIEFFAANLFNLKIDILPFNGFDIGMGPGGVFS